MTKIRKFAMYVLVAGLCASARGQAPTASELLQKGIYLEETVGNLDEAIQVYKQVVQTAAVSRVNAAQAEYRMAVCLQKKGQKAEASATLLKVIKQYPEQAEIVTQARESLITESKFQDTNDKPCKYLEDQLAGSPEDFTVQERATSCYWNAELKAGFVSDQARELEKKRLSHALWIVQHAAGREFSQDVWLSHMRSVENSTRLRQAWMNQVETHPDDLNVLLNASQFMSWNERDKAEEFASRAHSLYPDSIRATRVLAQLYEREMMIGTSLELKTQSAQKALRLREQIWSATDPDDDSAAFSELRPLAVDALIAGDNVKTRKYAEDLVRRSSGDLNHFGNVMLGRLALKNDNIEEAKFRLLAAGKVSGTPVLCSFGPNMTLARELLLKGEQEVVLQYFDECEKFWTNGTKRLDEWRQVVRQGRIPDFGTNLVY